MEKPITPNPFEDFYLCPRCQLRKSRQIDLKFYLDENIDDQDQAQHDQTKYCFACLGLLSKSSIRAYTEKVKESIDEWAKVSEGHDLRSIKVNLHTPPGLFITNYGQWFSKIWAAIQ